MDRSGDANQVSEWKEFLVRKQNLGSSNLYFWIKCGQMQMVVFQDKEQWKEEELF